MSDSDNELNVKGLAQILPYLWIGTADVASDSKVLKQHKFDCIINCASEDVDNFFPTEYTYHTFPIEDLESYDITPHFAPFYDIVTAVKENKQKCLVHCTTGKSISPTLILSYMMQSAKNQDKVLSLKKAFEHINSRYIGINPNDTFMSDLIALEESLFETTSLRIKSQGRSSGKPTYARGKGKRGK